MSDPGAVDVLDTGEPRRWLSRRAKVGLLLAALVAAGLGLVVDREVRSDERVALDRCAVAVQAAVRRSSGLIGYMVGYVRPTMAGLPGGDVRADIDALVSGAAVKALPSTRRAERACGGVEVLAFHDAHQARHDACGDLLAITRSHLERVRDDGRSAFVDGATRHALLRACAGRQ
ncbi:MAG TPA: hypothetical protein VFV40_10495 [Nocardioides sp.]|nr:hypothetical protein [Nocardioides sp.]